MKISSKAVLLCYMLTICFVRPASAGAAKVRGSWQPVLPVPGLTSFMAISYEHIGVQFTIEEKSGVDSVDIHSPIGESQTKPPADVPRPGESEVIPGRGAYGTLIGDSQDRLQSLEDAQYTTGIVQTPTGNAYAEYGFSDGRVLEAHIIGSHIAGITVSGPFHTPEGVTEKSTATHIRSAYGNPDIVWLVPLPSSVAQFWALAILIVLMSGYCCSTLSLKATKLRSLKNAPRIAVTTIAGGVGSLTGTMLVMFLEHGHLWGLTMWEPNLHWLVTLMAFTSGTVGALTYGVLSAYCNRLSGSAIVLIAVLITGAAGSQVIPLLWIRTALIGRDYLGLAISLTVFLMSFFFVQRRRDRGIGV